MGWPLWKDGLYPPVPRWPKSHAMVGVNVVCADTDDAAAWAFTSIQQRFLGMQRGRRGPLPTPIAPAQLESPWSPQEKAGVQRMLAAAAVGSPDSVRQQLDAIIEQTAADELIVAGSSVRLIETPKAAKPALVRAAAICGVSTI